MFWSKLCESKWISAWNLAFPVFISPIMCMENVWKSSLSIIGIFQRAVTQQPFGYNWLTTELGQLYSPPYTCTVIMSFCMRGTGPGQFNKIFTSVGIRARPETLDHFRPEIWHIFLFSVSSEWPSGIIMYDCRKTIAPMSQKISF